MICRFTLLGLVLLGTANLARASWADGLFDELSRDFGSVPHGMLLTHHFRVVNRTGATVHISSVRVSCGCTSAQALNDTLRPGQETSILVQMDTRRFYNTKAVTVFVQFDQPRFEEVRIWVQANSRDDVAVTPDGLAFGRVKRGTPSSAQVNVSFLGNGQTQILGASCDSNYVQLSYQPLRREADEVSYQLAARIRTDAPVGKWYTDVWVSTNNPMMPKVRVPLTVEIEAPLTLSPQTIILGMVKAGHQTDRKVIIRSVRPFRITSITGTDSAVSIRDSSNHSKTVHVLTVTLRPTAPGVLNRTIRVATDMKSGGEIEFNAKAQVMP
jgi:hypothetical protein